MGTVYERSQSEIPEGRHLPTDQSIQDNASTDGPSELSDREVFVPKYGWRESNKYGVIRCGRFQSRYVFWFDWPVAC
jgi:hypothetical protein